MSVLDDIRAKYQKTEQVSDSYGRILIARKLTTAQRLRVREMTENGDPEVVGTLTIAASLVSMDGLAFPFPKDRKELDGSIEALDDPGIAALVEAFKKLNEGPGEKETIDAAKN